MALYVPQLDRRCLEKNILHYHELFKVLKLNFHSNKKTSWLGWSETF